MIREKKMKKLFFFGHTYHLKTKSSLFLLDLLKTEFEVTEFYMDPAKSYEYTNLASFQNQSYDVLVVWQVMPQITELHKFISWKHAVFFPMYDHHVAQNGLYAEIWQDYQDFLVICFSKALHQELQSKGIVAKYIQYFPKPDAVENWGYERSLFFWQRLSFLDLRTLAKAAKNLAIDKIHLHKAMDPGHVAKSLEEFRFDREVTSFYKDIEFSESVWFEQKQDLMSKIDSSALYMAPRHLEGIGMSFLEAMAHGRCVIAPDCPTMNEYITNGVNGLLYPWEESSIIHCAAPVEAPTATIRQLQENAYQTIVKGYEKWNTEKYQILEWLEQDAHPDKEKLQRAAILHGWKDWPIEEQPWPDVSELEKHLTTKTPTEADYGEKTIDVSVVTVVFNAVKDGREDMLIQCLESVQMQRDVNIEHIIVDGASSDGTLQLIHDLVNKSYPIRIISLKDHGIYEAMNRGIALARGTYVVFLNSDDFYHKTDGLKMSVNTLQQTGCTFSFSPVRIIDDSWPAHPHACPYYHINDVFCQSVFSHQSVLTRREVMLQMHGFDLSYCSAADYDFILRMILTGHKGCYVSSPFVSYRMIGVSSTNREQSRCETAVIFKRLYNRFVQAHLTTNDAYRIYYYRTYPSNDPSLKSRLDDIMRKAFVGLPRHRSHLLSDLSYVTACLLRGRFSACYHFLLVRLSSRFDPDWYDITYREDMMQSKLSPAAHYLTQGWQKGNDPSPRFSTTHYLKNNPDVANMNICPLLHWKLKGRREKRML